jgi:NACalpha-BTF3-like transcription factor
VQRAEHNKGILRPRGRNQLAHPHPTAGTLTRNRPVDQKNDRGLTDFLIKMADEMAPKRGPFALDMTLSSGVVRAPEGGAFAVDVTLSSGVARTRGTDNRSANAQAQVPDAATLASFIDPFQRIYGGKEIEKRAMSTSASTSTPVPAGADSSNDDRSDSSSACGDRKEMDSTRAVSEAVDKSPEKMACINEWTDIGFGLDDEDIETIMTQCGVHRGLAISALRKCGNIVDAILSLSP